MEKSADAFRSIGEVAKLIGVAPHVLRYWETQFAQLKPMKRPDGRRYYRPDDVALAAGLCDILRDDGLTIRGAKKLIARDRGEAVRFRGLQRLNFIDGVAKHADQGKPVAEIQSPDVKPDISGPVPELTPAPATTESHQAITQPEISSVSGRQSSKPTMQRSSAKKPVVWRPAPSLPLFPDLTTHPDKRHAVWLSHLVRIATQLRQTQKLSGPVNQQCTFLRDAISRHY